MKRILILSANPKDTDRLRLDEEVREIQTGLERARTRDQFELIPRFALRVEDLRRALLDYEPQIVHFSGHGVGAEGLALEDSAGQMQVVSTASLAELFKLFQDTLECVVLNACYSEVQADAIHQYIDCVIGMNTAIGDRAATQFAIGFYDALGAGRAYDQAYAFGCNAIDLERISGSMTPVLKIRARSHKLAAAAGMNSAQPETDVPPGKIAQSISITGGTISIPGQISQARGDITQTQSLNRCDQPPTIPDVIALLSQIATLFSTSTLPDALRHKALTHLEAAREALQEQEPDRDYATRSLQKATRILQESSIPAEDSQRLWIQLKPLLQALLPQLGAASDHFGL